MQVIDNNLIFFRRPAGVVALLCLTLPMVSPAERAPDEPLRVAVVSDLNGAYGTTRYGRDVGSALESIVALQPDLVISAGDMIAAQRPRLLPRERVERMWVAFDREFATPLFEAGIPLAVTPGNHDASALPKFVGERVQFAHRWGRERARLGQVDEGNYPFYYAFVRDGVLFVGLDASTTAAMPDAEFEWLAGVLARAQGQFRYRVVFGHVPIWPYTQGREQESTRDRRLHRLLVEAHVDLFLSGHHHAFYPGMLDGVAYVSQACLGAGPRPRIGEDRPAPRAFTWIEFGDTGIRLASVTGKGFRATEPWSALPAAIAVGEPRLERADRVAAGIGELTWGEVQRRQGDAIQEMPPG